MTESSIRTRFVVTGVAGTKSKPIKSPSATSSVPPTTVTVSTAMLSTVTPATAVPLSVTATPASATSKSLVSMVTVVSFEPKPRISALDTVTG